ncbi:MAG: cation transporter [Rhodothermales bacterium]|nr:cation transporter [Rhodothermales bacterium]MBO6781539.1 cation transporter [Rhodothermales bacterium]
MKEIIIDGMSCGHCVRAVEEAIGTVPDAKGATVEMGKARLDVSDEALERVKAAIEEEGYAVTAVH